ncbi:MAG TPA: glycosyltransferase family 9 protein [Ignavibacteria bacterium]
MKIDKSKINKILVIKFGGMGDLLLMTPMLPNLRRYFPDAEIDIFTLKRSRDILIDNPYVTRILTFTPGTNSSWFLINNIRKKKFDLVIDLFCNPRTALITRLSGAKYRFGFKFKGRNYAYNIKARGRGGEVHNVDFNLDALRELGIPIVTKKLNLCINVVHEEFATKFIVENNIKSKSTMGICVTGGWETKKFKVSDYIKVMKMINALYDVNFVLFWGNEIEKKDCETIHKEFGNNSFLIPDSPIRYLAAIIRECDLIIGNDSGPMHIAVAVETPVLGIYGPTKPMLQGPYGEKNLTVVNDGLDCLYCDLLECKIGNICMTQLSKEKIIAKLKELIAINNLNFKEKVN